MGTKPTDAELGQLAKMYGRGWELLVNGSRTKADLQAFIEGRVASEPQLQKSTRGLVSRALIAGSPPWYVVPERQLEYVRKLNRKRRWGFKDADFPEIPDENLDVFYRLSMEKVLLLAVYLPGKGNVSGMQRTFEEHVCVIRNVLESECGLFWQASGVDANSMRLKCREHRPGLRWVVYDYAAHYRLAGHAVADLWDVDASNLAASEVLSAVMLFPEYWHSMLGLHAVTPRPLLAGYELPNVWNANKSGVPHLLPNDRYSLSLFLGEAERVYPWASPTVEEV